LRSGCDFFFCACLKNFYLFMKTLLVSMSRTATAYGTHPVRYAVLSGRKVLLQGQGAIDEMAQQGGQSMRLSVDSPANLTERLRLRALSRRFVPVLVQRHLTDSGTFTERFRVRSRMNWLRQGEAEVDVLAMLEDDAELAHELLPSRERPLTHLLTAEAAVAALVGAVTQASVLVHWWHVGGLRSLGVREGRVVWQRVQSFNVSAGNLGSGELDGGKWKTLLDAAVRSAPLEFSGLHGHVIRLGNGPWVNAGEWASNGSRELVVKLQALFQGLPGNEVLLQPELYGLAFASPRESLIVNGYRQRVMAWHVAPTLAATASLLGVVLLGAGLWWHTQAQQTLAALQQEQSTLQAQAQALQKLKPPAEAVTALRSAAWRETALGANLRADRFLKEMLSQIPVGVQVQSLTITRNGAAAERVRVADGQPVLQAKAGAGNGRKAQLARKKDSAKDPDAVSLQPAGFADGFTSGTPLRRMPVAGEPSFQVDLNIVVPGSYASAKLKAESLAERLTLMGRLSDTQLTFEDTATGTPGARLKTRLTIAAGAF
jgi:hypothetical protein